ncbi:MAG: hypothetical protein K2L19_05160, partial [Eubacterium sp.]|nr:hypothetical protein [Eubacterium sp.]
MKGLWGLALISASGMIVEAICELALPSIANTIYSRVSEANAGDADIKSYVIKTGLIMFALAVVGLCGGIATMKSSSVVGQKFSYRLRGDLYKKTSEFSFKNIDTFSTASLTTRMTNDVTMLQNTVIMMLRMLVRVPALLVLSAVFAFSINAKLSLIIVFLLPVILIIVV